MKPLASRSPFAAERLEDRLLLAADVVISELMAKNKKTLQDNFGVYSDWLELHNAGDADADLSRWYLTDKQTELTEWQFPAGTSLAAGAFMVVYASGDNIATLGQPFHTNFKLDDSGEYLALVQQDGSTVQYQYAPQFPNQTSDVSYGMADDDDPNSVREYFSTPTPGAPNEPNAAIATFSQPGGGHLSSISVVLSSTTPGAQIHYTTDGSVPTSSSPLYADPLTLNADTMLRTRTYAPNFTASPVSSQQYFILDSSVASFHSDLPLVVLDSFGNAIDQDDQTTVSAMVLPAPTDGSDTTLSQTPEFVGRAGLNIRGQTSTMFPKLQYHLEIWDESNNDTNASLLGMPADSDWVLYAPYSEKALMQNQLVYQWSNEIGEYAVRTQWCEVFLNTAGDAKINYADDYVGIYLLEEKIKIAPARVDITKIAKGDDTDPGITGGYIWHKDKPDANDPSFTTESGQTFLYDDPSASKLDDTQKAWLTGYINQFETALYGPNFTDLNVGYAHYIDVPSFVDNWILVEMAKNIDGFKFSTYYYKDVNGLIHMGPIWDYNLSMGNADYFGGDNPVGWYHDEISAQDYTYFDRLTQDPHFMQLVSDRWQQLRQTVFSTPSILNDINANVQTLTDGNGNIPVGPDPTQAPDNPVVRNFEKWDILGTAVWPNSYVGNSWLDEVNYLKNFMTTRAAWMDTQLDPVDPAALPGLPTLVVASALSASQVNVTWTPADIYANAFTIEQSADEGETWTLSGQAGVGLRSFIVNGLQPETHYLFRVTATNALGNSPVSDIASATTLAALPLVDQSSGFADAGLSMTLNDRTTIGDSSLVLTDPGVYELGSAFSNAPVNVLGFTTSFIFQLKDAEADGFTFTLQNDAPTALGLSGADLGYAGILKSIAIKFDLYNNNGEGVNSTGLFVDGDEPIAGGPHADDVSIDMTSSGIDLHRNPQFLVTLQYDRATLTEMILDMSSGASFSHAYAINIPSLLGSNVGYAGFTAATGVLGTTQEILNWTYTAASTLQNVIAGTSDDDTITLTLDEDQQHIDWSSGNASGQLLADSAGGLTIYGDGATEVINLDYANGNPLPTALHLSGTFVLNGLSGENPLAGVTLDINQSTLYITYTDSAPLAMIRGYLANGFNGGDWAGAPTATTGVITSWAAENSTAEMYGIGYVDSASGLIPGAPENSVELQLTMMGDTGLTGTVSFTDFMRMTQHFTVTDTATWTQGDFNYDGAVDASDFNLLQPNFEQIMPTLQPVEMPPPAEPVGTVRTPVAIAPATIVPEPVATPAATVETDPNPATSTVSSGPVPVDAVSAVTPLIAVKPPTESATPSEPVATPPAKSLASSTAAPAASVPASPSKSTIPVITGDVIAVASPVSPGTKSVAAVVVQPSTKSKAAAHPATVVATSKAVKVSKLATTKATFAVETPIVPTTVSSDNKNIAHPAAKLLAVIAAPAVATKPKPHSKR